MSEQPFIQIKDLYYAYKDENDQDIPVLKGIDLNIARGEYVVILGHNGSGKSTLAKLLNLILEAEKGQIIIDGQDKIGGAHV